MNKPVKVADELAAMDQINAMPLSQALVNALAEIEGVTKDKVNPHFKSKYADLSSVLDTVRPVFARYNMAVTQETAPSEDGVIVETVVLHASGEERRFGQLYVPANKRDAQGAGSALTYARRYSLMTALGIPADDDDGNAAVKATANPSTGEVPPAKRTKLDGPYTCPTQLMAAAKQFTRTLRGLGSIEEFDEWAKDAEVKAFVEQCKRDLPDWWFGGNGVPADFTPLEIEVRDTRRGLKQIAEMENN